MTNRIGSVDELALFAEQLATLGIKTTSDLLRHCRSPKGRSSICARTGVGGDRVARWSRLAELMEIKGIGAQYAELLEAAGIHTVEALLRHDARRLAAHLDAVNLEKHLSLRAPAVSQVSTWIEQAERTRH